MCPSTSVCLGAREDPPAADAGAAEAADPGRLKERPPKAALLAAGAAVLAAGVPKERPPKAALLAAGAALLAAGAPKGRPPKAADEAAGVDAAGAAADEAPARCTSYSGGVTWLPLQPAG